MIKKAIRYSFKLFSMLLQLESKHKNINKVVSKTKNKEIPSIPKVKLILRLGTHNIFVTNWNSPVDLSKKTHKINDNKNVILEVAKDMIFNIWLL